MAIVEIHVHSNADLTEVNQKLDKLLALAKSIKREEVVMEQEFTDLIQVVNDEKTVVASAVLAINGIVDKYNEAIAKAASLDEAKAAALQMKADIQGMSGDLGTAIANVPA
jgi:hypothetical protein